MVLSPDQGQLTDPAPAIASLNLPSATVVYVGDGDTLRMDYQGQNVTVRFACIDAPETTQTPWGTAATERLRQLTPRGSTIEFREADPADVVLVPRPVGLPGRALAQPAGAGVYPSPARSP